MEVGEEDQRGKAAVQGIESDGTRELTGSEAILTYVNS